MRIDTSPKATPPATAAQSTTTKIAGAAQAAAAAPATMKSGPREIAAQAALEVGFGPSSAPSGVRAAALRTFESALANVTITLPTGMAPRPAGVPALPWEDVREMALPGEQQVRAADLVDAFVFEWGGGKLDQVLSTWASTTHAHLWSTPLGQAVAEFGIERYAAASQQFDRRGKLGHVVAVLAHADRIALDQAARGNPMAPAWRERLEYAAYLHDIGYMNGGRFHPKKGANDLLAHFGERAPELPQKELEMIAMIVAQHGTSFPWDRLDQARLAGMHYVSVDVVEEIAAEPGRMQAYIDALKSDNADYIAQTGGLKWLDDPAEVKGLLRAGWVMHSADNFNGPRASFAGRDVGKIGVETPLRSVAELERFLRDRELTSAVRKVASHLGRIVDARVDAGAGALDRRLERLAALLDSLAHDPPDGSKTAAQSVRALLDTPDFKGLDGAMAALDEALQAKLAKASAWPPPSRRGPEPVVVDGPFSSQIRHILEALALTIEALPDRR
jgi:hypothetical protein